VRGGAPRGGAERPHTGAHARLAVCVYGT
jgi:hypothetical protein